jgi:hypothetical protein
MRGAALFGQMVDHCVSAWIPVGGTDSPSQLLRRTSDPEHPHMPLSAMAPDRRRAARAAAGQAGASLRFPAAPDPPAQPPAMKSTRRPQPSRAQDACSRSGARSGSRSTKAKRRPRTASVTR